jgi:methionine-rich copper-binding protein CopC
VEPIGYSGFSEGSVLMRVPSASVGLLLVTCLSIAMAGPAWAHAKLVESDPAGGDVLAEAPEQVHLRFDEPVQFEDPAGSELDLLDPIKVYNEENARVDKGNTRVSPDDPKVLLVDLKKLPDGVYGVDWDATSRDGHVIDGALGFTVDRSRATTERAADSEASDDSSSSLGTILAVSLAILAVCVVGLAGFVVLRRR